MCTIEKFKILSFREIFQNDNKVGYHAKKNFGAFSAEGGGDYNKLILKGSFSFLMSPLITMAVFADVFLAPRNSWGSSGGRSVGLGCSVIWSSVSGAGSGS